MGDKERAGDYSEAYIVVKSECKDCKKTKDCKFNSSINDMYRQLKENGPDNIKVEIVYDGVQMYHRVSLTDGLFPDKVMPQDYYFLYKLVDGRYAIMIPALRKEAQKPKTCNVEMYA